MVRKLKIKVSAGQLKALHAGFLWLIHNWSIDNKHDALLLQHAIEFEWLYEKQLHNEQKKYGLVFTELQALAFCQLWSENYKHLNEYGRVTVFTINAEIDQYRKSLKAIQHAETDKNT